MCVFFSLVKNVFGLYADFYVNGYITYYVNYSLFFWTNLVVLLGSK